MTTSIDHRQARGIMLAVAWLEQIRERTKLEPSDAHKQRITDDCFRNRPCRDCGTLIGQPHDHGCDVERCMYTGDQWIGCGGYTDEHGSPLCGCDDAENYDADGYTIHTCGQAPHDCGSEIWDGVWPGYVEAIEYGWYGHFELLEHPEFGLIESGRWTRCSPEHPQAGPDLTRVHLSCDWDRTRGRWVQRGKG